MCIIGFTITSMLCGAAQSLEQIVAVPPAAGRQQRRSGAAVAGDPVRHLPGRATGLRDGGLGHGAEVAQHEITKIARSLRMFSPGMREAGMREAGTAPHIRRWMRSRASRVATGSVAILIMSGSNKISRSTGKFGQGPNH